MSAPLIGHHCQAPRMISQVRHCVDQVPLRSHTGTGPRLQASVRRYGEPCFGTRSRRSRHFRLHPNHVHARDVPISASKIGHSAASSRPFLGLPAEISVINPHTAEDNGKFSGYRNRRLAMALGFHQFDAPGFQRRPFAITGDQSMGRNV